VKVVITAVGAAVTEAKTFEAQEEETMASAAYHPVPGIVRPWHRPARRKTDRGSAESEGTSVLRLFGAAVLGWVGLMIVVTILAV
jgi:hypothetical protein